MKSVEQARLELMGVGNPRPTAWQRRLRSLILCKPLLRRFGRRPDAEKLERLQERLHENRVKFITAHDEDEVRLLATAIVQTDALLGRSQDTSDLRQREEDVAA